MISFKAMGQFIFYGWLRLAHKEYDIAKGSFFININFASWQAVGYGYRDVGFMPILEPVWKQLEFTWFI